MSVNEDRVALWRRFPAAHQFLRARLMNEVYPIAPSVAAWVEPQRGGGWLVSLSWPEVPFASRECFTGDELRAVYGRWTNWTRICALAIAEQLPV